MGYLDEVGLEHLWGKAKGRFGMAAEGSGESVTAESASKLKGLTVHGKSVQDGTPTPSAPVEIRSVAGRNLLNPADAACGSSGTFYGVDYTLDEDGWFTVSGATTRTATIAPPLWGNTTADFLPAGTYTLSVETDGLEFSTQYRIQAYFDNGASSAVYISSSTHTVTFTASTVVNRISFYIYKNATGVEINGRFRVQLERGSIAHDYQPYGTISLNVGDPNGTYTSTPIPLDGNALCSTPDGAESILEVDSDGNVTMTKRVIEVTFDGSESWTSYSYDGVLGYYRNVDYAPLYHYNNALGKTYCSAFTYQNAAVANTWYFSSNREINFKYPTATTVDEWKVYLAENPLTVVYELETPQTISLGTIDMPELQDGDTIWVDAEVTPSVDAEWWTSQAEFKTINGESLLGEGNIQISGSGTIDAALSDTSANAVQNKVIKAALEALIAVETLYDSSTITVRRSGRTVMVQAHGVSVTPSTSTAVLANVLADYKPEYNISTTVLTSSGGSTQAARMVVYASDGGVYIVPAGYSSSASWYGTLTYIY